MKPSLNPGERFYCRLRRFQRRLRKQQASLGHTGRPLTATRPIQFMYVAAFVAALTRIVAAIDVLREPMLHISATAWVLAFGGFVVVYAPRLARRRA